MQHTIDSLGWNNGQNSSRWSNTGGFWLRLGSNATALFYIQKKKDQLVILVLNEVTKLQKPGVTASKGTLHYAWASGYLHITFRLENKEISRWYMLQKNLFHAIITTYNSPIKKIPSAPNTQPYWCLLKAHFEHWWPLRDINNKFSSYGSVLELKG